jgi:formate dehydrogenase major subunit
MPLSTPTRRDFLRTSTGGFTLGGLTSLGLDLRAAQAQVRQLDVRNAKNVISVCPYCAVGCGTVVTVEGERIVNIEGNPESPINQGTLCPKGAATYQLAVNPNRITKVKYRAPHATEWEERPLDWAMDRIARLTKQTRDAHFNEEVDVPGPNNTTVRKKVNNTYAIASLGGATMDNEWNYVQCKLMRALGVVNIENQARI